MRAEERPTYPTHQGLYYGGAWHAGVSKTLIDVRSPATGEHLAQVTFAVRGDVDRAVEAALDGYRLWREVKPSERARILREMAAIVQEHGPELAALDAVDCGNPVREMMGDAFTAAAQINFFAGLVTEMKGTSVPTESTSLNFSVREPLGVVARIVPFNHPFMFCAGKSAAPLAAGNAVILKPPDQAPLSGLRLAELVGHLFPPGAFNVVTGDGEAGSAMSAHPDVAAVGLIGSVPTGRAVMKAAADSIKPLLLELGGKNALIAFPDVDPAVVADAAVNGMNFTWCGQSCGSTSRAFIHESIYDAVASHLPRSAARFKPGLPLSESTTMGAIVSRTQYERVLQYIESAKREGARLLCGGGPPADPELRDGFFIEPTIFADVKPTMRIAREEIFGPILSVLPWSDPEALIREVNGTPYGLTCSIWTDDLGSAHRVAARVEAGYIWINQVSRHLLGTPFGGFKQSGLGREECLEELLSFTREKHIHVNLARRAPRSLA
jgi:betaine-aldehyde dehydrogenase